MSKINYVVGFAFSRDKNDIVLIEKDRPEWQKGKFNGVGGKMKDNESPTQAMFREFKEETGVTCPYWEQYAVLSINADVSLYCFRCFSNVIYQCKTQESEKIEVMAVDTVMGFKPLIHNLRVLIPMARDEDFQYAEIKAIVR